MDHIDQTIAHLQAKLRDQEGGVLKTKMLINQLCESAGKPPIYADAELQTTSGGMLSIRSDQFYGQPLAAGIRQILEMRKALNQGAASLNEIYDALVAGGYAFDTKNDDYAKRGLRSSITKNTVTFHKLPNGKFGLVEWYSNVKTPRKREDESADALTDETLNGGES